MSSPVFSKEFVCREETVIKGKRKENGDPVGGDHLRSGIHRPSLGSSSHARLARWPLLAGQQFSPSAFLALFSFNKIN
jgi:hypothetical protein